MPEYYLSLTGSLTSGVQPDIPALDTYYDKL